MKNSYSNIRNAVYHIAIAIFVLCTANATYAQSDIECSNLVSLVNQTEARYQELNEHIAELNTAQGAAVKSALRRACSGEDFEITEEDLQYVDRHLEVTVAVVKSLERVVTTIDTLDPSDMKLELCGVDSTARVELARDLVAHADAIAVALASGSMTEEELLTIYVKDLVDSTELGDFGDTLRGTSMNISAWTVEPTTDAIAGTWRDRLVH